MRIDWIAAFLTWIGNIVLIQTKSWICFCIFFVANTLWLFYWIPKKEWAAALLVFTFACQNIWGIYKWRKER